MVVRVKTGIPGFDDLIAGGFLPGSAVMISGPTGSGKSIFGLQFLYYGASSLGEPGIFVTLESRPNEVRAAAQSFNWDVSTLEKKGLFIIVDAASNKAGLPTSEKHALRRGFDTTALAEEIYNIVAESGARRLVLDSLSGLGIRFSEPSEVRTEVFRITSFLNELNLTSLLISDAGIHTPQSRAGVEQYVTQGLVLLRIHDDGPSLRRSLLVWKMRHTRHDLRWHQLHIDQDGLHVGAPIDS
ncbi:MAG: ATPase [Candidatus Thorarchaeota archaeon]|nr:MAG: ATPase [Candidatus Thorarchaeota archaeon]